MSEDDDARWLRHAHRMMDEGQGLWGLRVFSTRHLLSCSKRDHLHVAARMALIQCARDGTECALCRKMIRCDIDGTGAYESDPPSSVGVMYPHVDAPANAFGMVICQPCDGADLHRRLFEMLKREVFSGETRDVQLHHRPGRA